MFKNNDRVRIEGGGLHQPLQIGSVARVGDLEPANIGHHAFHTTTVVRPPAAVGPDGNAQDHVDRKFSVAQIVTPAHLGKQLIQPRPDIIGKLYFHDGFQPDRTHTYRTTYDESLLNGGIENPFVAKLLGQRSRFAKNSPQTSAHILSVQQGFGSFAQNLLDGTQRTVHHDRFGSPFRFSVAAFFGYRSWGKVVIEQTFGSRIGGGAGAGIVGI